MHPIFLYITENFYIGTYGVLIALGVFAGVFTAIRRTRRLTVPDDFVFDLSFYMIISGIIGSRILFIIINWKDFLLSPMALLLSREGFVFQGGFVAALIVGIYFIRRRGYPFFVIGDAVIPSVPLAHFFGRLGCFSAGCCYGKVCGHGWEFLGVRFPAVFNKKGELIGSFPYLDHLNHELVDSASKFSLPVIPTQLIEAFLNLSIFFVLHKLYIKRKFDGQMVALYLISYSVMRFLVEFLRGDADRRIWFGFISTGQALSLFTVCLGIWIYSAMRNKKATESLKKAPINK